MPDEECKSAILSEDTLDFIIDSNYITEEIRGQIVCDIPLNDAWSILYFKENITDEPLIETYSYVATPKCFALMDRDNYEQDAVYFQAEPNPLGLTGQGVMIGVIGTGIEYENSSFRNEDGSSRIAAIWDQTIQSQTPPEGYLYGSEYTREMINEALRSENPGQLVPTEDTIGDGTYLASVAAGGESADGLVSGVATGAEIAVVKLKEAKQYLRDLYLISPDALAYQETDILLALKYLSELAFKNGRPLVVCLSFGGNTGGHASQFYLAQYISFLSFGKRAIVIGTGDEANKRHHFRDVFKDDSQYIDVEMETRGNDTGVWLSLWGNAPDIFTVSVTSPSGDIFPRVPYQTGENVSYTFLFENTDITINYISYGNEVSNPAVIIRLIQPADGVWKIRVFGSKIVYGQFNIWLPVTEFIQGSAVFLRSDPEVTLVEPSSTQGALTVSAYNTSNNSIYLESGRGFTPSGRIKPELAAPGVGVPGVAPSGRTVFRSGTSSAAAITAGSAALMYEWGIVRENAPAIGAATIKSYLIQGAQKSSNRVYPNPEWGYGTLDVNVAFENFRAL